jgi:hypothetical protein
MSTTFRPLEIPPGVVAKPTKQMKSSQWAEVNLMRWVEGQLSPVGGQSQYAYTFASRCKAVHGWYDLVGNFYIAYLCEQNLYVDSGGTLTDITPVGGMTPPSSASASSNYSVGDYSAGYYSTNNPIPPLSSLPDAWSLDNFGAILLGMSSADGRLLQWDPASALVNVYQDYVTAACPSGTTVLPMTNPVPATVLAGMTVTDQSANATVGTVASISGDNVILTSGSLTAILNGDELVFSTVDPANAQAIPVTSGDTGTGYAPGGRLFVVTPERFVIIFATTGDGTVAGGSMRRFAWCDQENFNSWNFSDVVSQAGFLDVEPASPIIAAKNTPQGTLFWTATTAYLIAFLGEPYIYNYTKMAVGCTPWSPQSIASATAVTLWMSQQGMFSWNGAWIQPVPCAVKPWVDDDIDVFNVREQACAVNNANFNEFWWFFPQNGRLSNTRCIIYNYKEQWWSQGQMSRSAGVTSSYTMPAVMADGLFAYEHELGNIYPNATQLPWAQTFDLNLNSGSRLTTVKQMIPDVGGDVNNLRYSLFYRMSRSVQADPNGFPVLVEELQTTPRTVNTTNGYVDFRTTGRDIRLKIELAGPEVNFVTVGQHLVDSVNRGDR